MDTTKWIYWKVLWKWIGTFSWNHLYRLWDLSLKKHSTLLWTVQIITNLGNCSWFFILVQYWSLFDHMLRNVWLDRRKQLLRDIFHLSNPRKHAHSNYLFLFERHVGIANRSLIQEWHWEETTTNYWKLLNGWARNFSTAAIMQISIYWDVWVICSTNITSWSATTHQSPLQYF